MEKKSFIEQNYDIATIVKIKKKRRDLLDFFNANFAHKREFEARLKLKGSNPKYIEKKVSKYRVAIACGLYIRNRIASLDFL